MHHWSGTCSSGVVVVSSSSGSGGSLVVVEEIAMVVAKQVLLRNFMSKPILQLLCEANFCSIDVRSSFGTLVYVPSISGSSHVSGGSRSV
jgi:hypothetical protein